MSIAERLPRHLLTVDGRKRRIGVEIEFGGLDLPAAAEVVQRLFGGSIAAPGPHQMNVAGTRLGDFEVALDTRLAHVPERAPDDGLLESAQREAAGIAGDVMQIWTPREISSPPLPVTELRCMDELAAALRRAGASGSAAEPYYAYALQLNPEARCLESAHVLRVLQSFLLMEDWLRARSLRDVSRKLSRFVRHFPEAYRRHVLQPGYRPGWDAMVRDYLAANRTRNRDLDMLPLFAHCRPALVAELFRDDRVKARPTYHYRLPDSRIDEPGWSIDREWQNWLRVERLADDARRFERARTAYLDWGARADRDVWRTWLGENLLRDEEGGESAAAPEGPMRRSR